MANYNASDCPENQTNEDDEVVERAEVVGVRAVRLSLALEDEDNHACEGGAVVFDSAVVPFEIVPLALPRSAPALSGRCGLSPPCQVTGVVSYFELAVVVVLGTF